jgi:hypothetical protein
MESKEVTFILTSCGRQDLLEKTIDSFLQYNTYPIKEYWIYEDSGIQGINDHLKKKYPFINWIEPAERTGQIIALDTLWSKVKTPYAMTFEDDWICLRDGFIQESMDILEAHPKIMQVWLRDRSDANGHPVEWPSNLSFGIMKSNHGLWTGLCWNPSLKRKSDYNLLKAYNNHTQFLRKRPWQAESDIGKMYARMGFKAAMLSVAAVKHIGNERHVS